MVDNVVEALGCCAVALGREDGGCVGVVCAAASKVSDGVADGAGDVGVATPAGGGARG